MIDRIAAVIGGAEDADTEAAVASSAASVATVQFTRRPGKIIGVTRTFPVDRRRRDAYILSCQTGESR